VIGQILAALWITLATVVVAGVPLGVHDPHQIRPRRNR
jgi:hypothetical protein